MKNAYLAVILAPPCIPLVVLALCLVIYFKVLGLPKSLISVMIGHVVLTAPFVFAIIRLRLHSLDRSLEMAAWNLGAGEWATLATIVLPQLRMAIIASFLLAFAVSWDEFIIAWFLSALDVTLPVYL